MNALMMKIAARHRQEFNRPKSSAQSADRFHFHKAYFRKPFADPMSHPMFAEDDDTAHERMANLYKKYGKRYYPSPPIGHPKHNAESWKKSVDEHHAFVKNPNNIMRENLRHINNAGRANEEMLLSAWSLRSDDRLGDEKSKKQWLEDYKHPRDEAMYLRNIRNQHLKKETNEKRRGELPQVGIGDPNKKREHEPAQEKEGGSAPANNQGMSRAAKIGLGIAGAGAVAYGAHKLNKYLKKRREIRAKEEDSVEEKG
jgi:hypothetical protein